MFNKDTDTEKDIWNYCENVSKTFTWFDTAAVYKPEDIEVLLEEGETLFNTYPDLPPVVLTAIDQSQLALVEVMVSLDAPEKIRNLAQATQHSTRAHVLYQANKNAISNHLNNKSLSKRTSSRSSSRSSFRSNAKSQVLPLGEWVSDREMAENLDAGVYYVLSTGEYFNNKNTLAAFLKQNDENINHTRYRTIEIPQLYVYWRILRNQAQIIIGTSEFNEQRYVDSFNLGFNRVRFDDYQTAFSWSDATARILANDLSKSPDFNEIVSVGIYVDTPLLENAFTPVYVYYIQRKSA